MKKLLSVTDPLVPDNTRRPPPLSNVDMNTLPVPLELRDKFPLVSAAATVLLLICMLLILAIVRLPTLVMFGCAAVVTVPAVVADPAVPAVATFRLATCVVEVTVNGAVPGPTFDINTGAVTLAFANITPVPFGVSKMLPLVSVELIVFPLVPTRRFAASM